MDWQRARKPEQKAFRRREILEAAYALFSEMEYSRISLNAIAQQTLGTQKTGDGLDAIAYYQNQEWDKLAKYCMKDVAITRDIYDFGRQKGYVSYLNKWNNLSNVDVDFSFTPTSAPGVQMTLV